MKSTGQTPITHPTPKKLWTLLDNTIEEVHRVRFCVDMFDWGRNGKPGVPMHVHIPVPNHTDSAWLLVDYELTTDKDFEEMRERLSVTITVVKHMEDEKRRLKEKGRTRKKKSV